ncbi:glycosyltransferase family 2 protein [Aquibacillus saliphilus]|uniref:glycosyltransferase family 2 protein n=1 Tax=Aquibacillus saliphilus TaxID=1909422 RepID=UPI001CF050B8|nr:glycosyltransferase family 2 protein [Aquibacillus saliphilus]
MVKVSFIVSAYNIQDYISKCVQSLMNQTLEDIEIIIVNDGSTDNTFSEIEKITKEDNRIEIIDKNNEGVMRARETGYEQANGEYILFVDGDDWLDENAAEKLYEKAKEKDYDIVSFGFYFTDGEKKVKGISVRNDLYDNLKGDNFLVMVLTNKIYPPLWSKLIKRSFIKSNNVVFPNFIEKAQDLAFSCSLGIHYPNSCVIDDCLYYYFTSRSTSVTNTMSPIIFEVEKAVSFIRKQLKFNNMLKSYKEEFDFLAFYHLYWVNRRLIYDNNKFSKPIYKMWKSTGIDLRKNKYFNHLIMKESFKARVIIKMIIYNYTLGRLIVNFHGFYINILKKRNTFV